METECSLSIKSNYGKGFENNFEQMVLHTFPGATYDGVYEFFLLIKEDIEDSKFPADKMCICPRWSGHNNKFGIIYSYKGKRICAQSFQVNGVLRFEKENYEMYDIKAETPSFEDKCFEIFKSILDRIWKSYGNAFLNRYFLENGLKLNEETSVILDYYEPKDRYSCDSVKVSETTIKGTWHDIFDTFTTLNDRLRYCNGSYYKFQNPKLRDVMATYIRHYNGDWYLDNAQKRGVIID